MATTKISGDTQDGMSEGGGHWCAESCCKGEREVRERLDRSKKDTLLHPLHSLSYPGSSPAEEDAGYKATTN